MNSEEMIDAFHDLINRLRLLRDFQEVILIK